MSDLFSLFEQFRRIGWKLEVAVSTSPYRSNGIIFECLLVNQIGMGHTSCTFDTLSEVLKFLSDEYAKLL